MAGKKVSTPAASNGGNGAEVLKPIAAVLDFVKTTAELTEDLKMACQMVSRKFPAILVAQATETSEAVIARNADELYGALSGYPAFRRYFAQEIVAKAQAAMDEEDYVEYVGKLAEARARVEAIKNQMRAYVETAVAPAKLSDFVTWTPESLQAVGSKRESAGSGGRGTRYEPKLDEYEFSHKDENFILRRDGDGWVVLDEAGNVISEGKSHSQAVNNLMKNYFDNTTSISVPRLVGMEAQEIAAGVA
jgi:hypothetical protein